MKKNSFNAGKTGGLYYFRDNVGNEVDLISEKNGEPLALEIKASKRIKSDMLKGLHFWQKNQALGQSVLLHAGTANELVNDRMGIAPWTEIENF
jgi:predicted AAA+ superfamily ATPase